MKLTKRMKNAVLQALIINLVFALILSAVFFFSIYPKTKVYFGKIDELEQLSKDYNNLESRGLTLGDARRVSTKYNISKDVFTKNVIQDFDALLFSNNFTNTGSLSYLEFLNEVQADVNTLKQTPEYISRDSTLNSILPIYSFDGKADEGYLTDFYFINYIEKLLYTFNLTSNGGIGVTALQKVEDENQATNPSDKQTQSISENIYRIPMNFSVTGQKQNIVDFIHFLENVGSISLTSAGIDTHNDEFISKVIEGSEDTENYNIYENQISVIDSISFSEYPDSATTESGEDLIETMKIIQARQKYSVDVDVSFYVAGVPSYQMQNYITDFYDNFDETFKEITALSSQVTKEKNTYTETQKIEAVQKIQSLDLLMISFQKDIAAGRDIEISTIDESTYDTFVTNNDKLEKIRILYDSLNSIFTEK